MVETCRELLRNNGFIKDMSVGLDEIWINNDYFRKDILTIIP